METPICTQQDHDEAEWGPGPDICDACGKPQDLSEVAETPMLNDKMYVVTRVELGQVTGVWGPFHTLNEARNQADLYNEQRGHAEFASEMFFDAWRVRVPQ